MKKLSKASRVRLAKSICQSARDLKRFIEQDEQSILILYEANSIKLLVEHLLADETADP